MKDKINMIENLWLYLKMLGLYIYDTAKNNDDWNEIIPRIYIGNCRSAFDEEFIKNQKIGLIINCTKEIPYKTDIITENGIKTIRIPVLDNEKEKEIEKMGLFLPEVYKDIALYYENNPTKSILIHCFAGKQRSAICASYFIHNFFYVKKDDAISIIKSKRPTCFQPKINFYNSF